MLYKAKIAVVLFGCNLCLIYNIFNFFFPKFLVALPRALFKDLRGVFKSFLLFPEFHSPWDKNKEKISKLKNQPLVLLNIFLRNFFFSIIYSLFIFSRKKRGEVFSCIMNFLSLLKFFVIILKKKSFNFGLK